MCVNFLNSDLESSHKMPKIEEKLLKMLFNKWRTDY